MSLNLRLHHPTRLPPAWSGREAGVCDRRHKLKRRPKAAPSGVWRCGGAARGAGRRPPQWSRWQGRGRV